MEGELGEHHAGASRRESAEWRAERNIAEELRRQGWTEADLGMGRKSDTVRLALATRLRRARAAPERLRRRRRETTLTVGWIARRLTLRTRKSGAAKPQRWTRGTRERGVRHGKTMV